MIKLVALSKTYHLKSGEARALNNVYLDLPEKGLIFFSASLAVANRLYLTY